jgi:predicted alpha-1,6-mannanase (GH76 family)
VSEAAAPAIRPDVWAAEAEKAVTSRHLRRLWALPGTALGVVGWPPTRGEILFGRWHYWWQAHLLDCLVDAELRDPDAGRRGRIERLTRGIRLRNGWRWHNAYYDDMSWLALALQRAAPLVDAPFAGPIHSLTDRITAAWSPQLGGIPWRRGDEYRNTPANGPAAILMARTGNVVRAVETLDWIRARLELAGGLIADGWRPDIVDETAYSYCQGVVLGAELELSRRVGRPIDPLCALVAAVGNQLAPGGVLFGHGGGNGGLFTGILARYLAQVAIDLPGGQYAAATTRRRCAALVLASASAIWRGRLTTPDGSVFAADWLRPADPPRRGGAGRVVGNAVVESSTTPERDLSVQLGAWMALEAAALVVRSAAPDTLPG